MPIKGEEEDKEHVLMPVINSEKYVADLIVRSKSFERSLPFKIGEIVTWKDGMQNKLVPDTGVPGIVLNYFFPPIYDQDREVSSTYFNDVLDIQVGFISRENEFIIFAHDSRRFKKYEVIT